MIALRSALTMNQYRLLSIDRQKWTDVMIFFPPRTPHWGGLMVPFYRVPPHCHPSFNLIVAMC